MWYPSCLQQEVKRSVEPLVAELNKIQQEKCTMEQVTSVTCWFIHFKESKDINLHISWEPNGCYRMEMIKWYSGSTQWCLILQAQTETYSLSKYSSKGIELGGPLVL